MLATRSRRKLRRLSSYNGLKLPLCRLPSALLGGGFLFSEGTTAMHQQRTVGGKFAKNNRGGPGNPHSGQVAKLRSAMLHSFTPERMQTVISKLIDMAESGDLKSIDLLLSRALGKIPEATTMIEPKHEPADDEDRIARARRIIAKIEADRASGTPSPSGPPSPAVQELLDAIARRRANDDTEDRIADVRLAAADAARAAEIG